MSKILLIILGSLISYSVSGQCNLEKEKNLETGVESRSTSPEQIGELGKKGSIYFYLIEYNKGETKEKSLKLCISIQRRTSRCIDSNSKIQIKIGPSVLEMKLLGKFDCGDHFFNYVELTSEAQNSLKKNLIDTIKVFYEEGTDNFDIINNLYFQTTLKCFDRPW
jgi:hypothetical protein